MAEKIEKKLGTGFPGELNEEQLKAFNIFRDFVYNQCGCKNPPYDEYALCRFLRARKFQVDKSMKMFTDTLQWRINFDIENIYKFKLTEITKIQEFYPHGYHLTDKQGRPIYIEQYSKMNIDKLWENTTEERILKYFAQSYEYLLHNILPVCSKIKGKPVTQTLTILDVSGVGLGMFKKIKKFFEVISKIASDNYPEILGKMIIINAPFIFSALFTLAKPFIDAGTRKKITVIGTGYKKELLELVSEENLPSIFGGKCTCGQFGGCLKGQNIGPWNPEGKSLAVHDFQQPFQVEDYFLMTEHKKKLQQQQQQQQYQQQQQQQQEQFIPQQGQFIPQQGQFVQNQQFQQIEEQKKQ